MNKRREIEMKRATLGVGRLSAPLRKTSFAVDILKIRRRAFIYLRQKPLCPAFGVVEMARDAKRTTGTCKNPVYAWRMQRLYGRIPASVMQVIIAGDIEARHEPGSHDPPSASVTAALPPVRPSGAAGAKVNL